MDKSFAVYAQKCPDYLLETQKLFPEMGLHWSRQHEWPFCLYHAELDKSHICLDIGSGDSPIKYRVAESCKNLYCLEYEPFDKSEKKDNIYFIKGDGRYVPFPAQSFDRVFCISVIEHIPENRFKVIEETVRVLKPGGKLLLTYDVLMSGVCSITNREESNKILDYLKIDRIDHSPTIEMCSFMENGKSHTIAAILVHYVKP